jgi:hypothetical protein
MLILKDRLSGQHDVQLMPRVADSGIRQFNMSQAGSGQKTRIRKKVI